METELMRGFARKLSTAAAIVSMLSVSTPLPAQAGSATDYVPQGSCAAEVAQVQALDPQADVASALALPWTFRFDDDDMAQTPRVMLAHAKLMEDEAEGNRAQGRRLDTANSLLGACAYRTAASHIETLVRQQAPNGLRHFVTSADCGGEQAAYAAAYADDIRRNNPRVADSLGRETAAAFVEGVAYLHVLANNGRGLTADDYKAMTQPYAYSEPRQKAADALRACLFTLAYQRGAPSQTKVALAKQTAQVRPAAPPPVDPCSGDRLAALNGEISNVDAKLERFMNESEYGKAQGLKVATPMLQVTMWGLERQIAAISKYCPTSPKAQERLADLRSSLTHARDACDQIQSGGRKCASSDPDTVK